MPGWRLRYDGWDRAAEPLHRALCPTLGGSLEVPLPRQRPSRATAP